jgi:hypothetical protein
MERDAAPPEPPIFLGVPGCRTYLSVAEAEGDIEPPDVAESPLDDAAGRELRAIPHEEDWSVRIVAIEAEPGHREELAAYLRSELSPDPTSYLARSGILERLEVTDEWLASASLEELAARAAEVELAWRNRPTLLRRLHRLLHLSSA